jgi:hypothetical protein
MHSPEKRSTHAIGLRESGTDVRRSLKALLEPQSSGTSSTQWTFTHIHLGSRSSRAHAKLSCLLAIHEVQWGGFINGNQQVPEEWKLFPGPLWDQFHERFFGSTSTTKDALEWIKGEYRQDQQERLADHRLHPNIEDAFWNKEFFDALRSGNWSSANFRSMIETREVGFKQEGKTALILNLISHTETTLMLGGNMAELGISVV